MKPAMLSLTFGSAVLCAVLAGAAHAADVELRIMQTTDLHMHAMNHDYYRNAEVNDFGLARTATLISDARAEARNSLLFDNGDLIQGNPTGSNSRKRWIAVLPVTLFLWVKTERPPVFESPLQE